MPSALVDNHTGDVPYISQYAMQSLLLSLRMYAPIERIREKLVRGFLACAYYAVAEWWCGARSNEISS